MPRRVLLALTVLWLAGCGGAAREPAALDQGALLTASCSGCHATGGESVTSLQGMSSVELRAKLEAYRSDSDGNTAMHRMARGYSDQQIALIAQTLGK